MAKHFQTQARKVFKKRHGFLIALIIMTIFSVQGFLIVEKNLEPALKEIARTYVKQLATLAINDAISKKISEEMTEADHLYKIEKNNDGEIRLFSYDQAKQARIVTLVTDRANQVLLELSKEPVPLPFGQALGSNILAQLGPDIPITLVPMGAAKAEIFVRLEESGINTVAVIATLRIEADVRIVIPFSSEEAVVTTELPIAIDILPGKVPDYYFRGGDGQGQGAPMPNISLPGTGG